VEVDMKIKRYTADSMRAALAQVRLEQGPDAVILSSRRSQEGIEVIAAVDYDEALFVDAKQQRIAPQGEAMTSPLPAATPMAAPPVPPAAAMPQRPAPVRRAVPAPLPVRRPLPVITPASAAPPRTDAGYSLMQREMQEMRRLLETGMAGMTWSDKRLREPLKAQVLEQLTAMDIAPDVAMAIAEQTPRRTSLENTANLPLALLIKHLPIGIDQTCVTGGITALVGPTGAGKTTTIAKLAARWCLAHGSRDLALISTDAYRIGAREQLMTYARILDVPMYTANSGKELGRLLARLSAKKLVLIDTAGMGPRDVRLTEQMAALKLGAAKAKVLLTLPAQGEGQALEEIVRAFAGVSPQACILTKVDEAASLGGVLSATIRHKLKIAYLCNGQRVPEDMHAAEPRRVWLVRAALHMKRGAPRVRDEAYLARTFGRAHAHG
jgi:flagellar biosynthesis protein FlhF